MADLNRMTHKVESLGREIARLMNGQPLDVSVAALEILLADIFVRTAADRAGAREMASQSAERIAECVSNDRRHPR